jgi:hypothetical protein
MPVAGFVFQFFVIDAGVSEVSRNKRFHHQTHWRGTYSRLDEQGFTCLQCRLYVSCDPILAGVQNRNHCPCCLWSRHLDWRTPGDRLAACRSAMQPIGLTTKRCMNKYAGERSGELMIVHVCTRCEKVVINRIAADDSATALCELFAESCDISAGLQAEIANSHVSILTRGDSELVRRRLFGDVASLQHEY